MRRIAVWFLVILSSASLFGQSGSADFGLNDPSKAVCEVVGSKLREAGTNEIRLLIKLDKKGRVRSFEVVSPKHFEKTEEAANTIKSLQFKAVRSPVQTQIVAEFNCAEPRHWSVAPRLIHSVDPEYPESAYRDGARGTVSVQLTIQVDGVPKDLKIAKGSRPDLNESALDAVRQWRFQPALKDGEPEEQTVVLDVSFYGVIGR
jgi:TonB family protein